MELRQFDFIAKEITIDAEEILRLVGNPEGDMNHHTRDLISHYTGRCKELAFPRGGYAWSGSGNVLSEQELMFEGIRFRVGKIIARELHQAEAFAFFTVSLGPGPEKMGRELIRSGNYLEGYLVDLIGSGMVESLVDQMHTHIKTMAGTRGMKVTNHYSPGYCSWEVNEQQKLFKLMPPGWCGITLSESSLMSPIKSISGIIGIGPEVAYHPASCALCPMPHCQFRKNPSQLP